MSSISPVNFKVEILRALASELVQGQPLPPLNVRPKRHKINLIGREFQRGDLERMLDVTFSAAERALAARSIEELQRDGYIVPTYADLSEPENWLVITESGLEHLQRGLKDKIDAHLETVSPHLVELRHGMKDALERTSPDATRQAANSARELIDQLLKEGVPAEGLTRRERLVALLKKHNEDEAAQKHSLRVGDAISAFKEYDAVMGLVHRRGTPDRNNVQAVVNAAEKLLRLLFVD